MQHANDRHTVMLGLTWLVAVVFAGCGGGEVEPSSPGWSLSERLPGPCIDAPKSDEPCEACGGRCGARQTCYDGECLDVPALSVGHSKTCAIPSPGEPVVCWGSPYAPRELEQGFVDVELWVNICALRSDGTARCEYIGSTHRDERTLVAPEGKFVDLASDETYFCGVRPDGRVVCWGVPDLHTPTEPPSDTFVQIDAFDQTFCGVRTDETLRCWGGHNAIGEEEPPGGTFRKVAVGQSNSCGIRTDGTLSCWGGQNTGVTDTPEGTFLDVDVGRSIACGLRDDGRLICWAGHLHYTAEEMPSPSQGTYLSMSVGSYHMCAVREDTTIACRGRNDRRIDIPESLRRPNEP